MFGWRSFEIYPLQVRTAGATPVQVPLNDYTFDLDAMLAAITDRTRLIFICNPNNPTSHRRRPRCAGPLRRGGAVATSSSRSTRPTSSTSATGCCPTASAWSAHTAMSLCCGPSRRRTGWRACASATPSAIRTSSPRSARSTCRSPRRASRRPPPSHPWTPPTNCSRRTDAVVAERARVTAALREAGYTVPPSQANFVWLPLAERAQRVRNGAANSRVIVRPYGQDGVRVTVAAPHENDAFLEFATRWIATMHDEPMTRTKDVRRVHRTHRADPRRRARRLLGHAAARHHRLHDRRVEGRRVPDRPPRPTASWSGSTGSARPSIRPSDAKPLVCLDAEGNKFSNTEAMNGEASLWLEEFRGEVTASMVYDGARCTTTSRRSTTTPSSAS